MTSSSSVKKDQPSAALVFSLAAIAGATTLLWSLKRRHRRSFQSSSRSLTRIPNLAKSQVLELRKRYFSKAVSVSYANTNPLLIVGVSDACLRRRDSTSFKKANTRFSYKALLCVRWHFPLWLGHIRTTRKAI